MILFLLLLFRNLLEVSWSYKEMSLTHKQLSERTVLISSRFPNEVMEDFRMWLASWAASMYVRGRKCFYLHRACLEGKAQALHCTGVGRPSRRMNSYHNRYWRLVIDTGGLWLLATDFPTCRCSFVDKPQTWQQKVWKASLLGSVSTWASCASSMSEVVLQRESNGQW